MTRVFGEKGASIWAFCWNMKTIHRLLANSTNQIEEGCVCVRVCACVDSCHWILAIAREVDKNAPFNLSLQIPMVLFSHCII